MKVLAVPCTDRLSSDIADGKDDTAFDIEWRLEAEMFAIPSRRRRQISYFQVHGVESLFCVKLKMQLFAPSTV